VVDSHQAIMPHNGLLDCIGSSLVCISPWWKICITLLCCKFCQYLSMLCYLWHNVAHKSTEPSHLLCTAWPRPVYHVICLLCISLNSVRQYVVAQKVNLSLK
jgi:hypothetical protein